MLDANLSQPLHERVFAPKAEAMPAPDAEESLNLLEFIGIDLLENEEMKVVYKETTSILRRHLCQVAAQPGTASFVLTQPPNVSKGFITGLDKLDPNALILLALWGVAHDSIGHHWCANSWGVNVVNSVAQYLGSEWQIFLSWPLKVSLIKKLRG